MARVGSGLPAGGGGRMELRSAGGFPSPWHTGGKGEGLVEVAWSFAHPWLLPYFEK